MENWHRQFSVSSLETAKAASLWRSFINEVYYPIEVFDIRKDEFAGNLEEIRLGDIQITSSLPRNSRSSGPGSTQSSIAARISFSSSRNAASFPAANSARTDDRRNIPRHCFSARSPIGLPAPTTIQI
jgi:hypothetical protein